MRVVGVGRGTEVPRRAISRALATHGPRAGRVGGAALPTAADPASQTGLRAARARFGEWNGERALSEARSPGRLGQGEAAPRRWVLPTTRDNESAWRQMYEPLMVASWASALERCPMKYSISDSDSTTFIFGDGGNAFEFAFDAGALRSFLKLGAEALHTMDAQAEQEQSRSGGPRCGQ